VRYFDSIRRCTGDNRFNVSLLVQALSRSSIHAHYCILQVQQCDSIAKVRGWLSEDPGSNCGV
jgi:hypothetical protein